MQAGKSNFSVEAGLMKGKTDSPAYRADALSEKESEADSSWHGWED